MSGYSGIVLFNYRLKRQLGEGGFGVVYEAIHEQLGRRAAVKILHPGYARQDQVVARFFREAQAACAVGHRAIVDITNYGRLDSGEPFIMMDFCEGRSLADLLAQDGPLPLAWVTAVFGPVASALAAAHGKGVIHRDLKPDNIMVALEGRHVADVKLLDFGIAKLTEIEPGAVATRSGTIMGTPNYMAPEQATDASAIDARADVYSFAATVFAALTGRPPFAADSTTALLLMVTTRPAPRLRSLRSDVPEAFDDIIAQCMEKDPELRPATIVGAWRAIKRALGESLDEDDIRPAASASFATPTGPAHRTTLSAASGQSVGARLRAHRLGFGLLTLGVLMMIAATIALTRGSTGSSSGSGTSSRDAAIDAPPTTVDAAVDAAAVDAATVDAAAYPDAAMAIDAGIDAAPAIRAQCALKPLERAVTLATRRQAAALRRTIERCAADGELGRRDRDRFLATLKTIDVATQTETIDAGAGTGSITEPPPPPPLVCSDESFKIWKGRTPSKAEARSAMERLAKCRERGEIAVDRAAALHAQLSRFL